MKSCKTFCCAFQYSAQEETQMTSHENPLYTAPCNGAMQPWSSNWRYLGPYRPNIQKLTQTKQTPSCLCKCSCASVERHAAIQACYHHTQIALDAGDRHTHLTNHNYFDQGETPKDTQLEPHAGKTMASTSGISSLNL